MITTERRVRWRVRFTVDGREYRYVVSDPTAAAELIDTARRWMLGAVRVVDVEPIVSRVLAGSAA